jgi:hypothetical protein
MPSFGRRCPAHGIKRLTSPFSCAVSNRSPLAIGNPLPLYNRLSATTVFKSDGISTQYTMQFQNGERIGPITGASGHLHIQEHEPAWQIFVPRSRHSREVSYRSALPDALTKVFKITQTARENIGHVLNSSTLVIDDILEHAGIAQVPGIEPPPRRGNQSTDGEESEDDGNDPSESEIIVVPDQLSPEASEEDETTMRDSSWAEPSLSSVLAENRASTSIPQDIIPHSPTSAYPGRGDLHRRNAYLELLNNVIRIADQTILPHNGALPNPGNGRLLQNFNHEAAFGVRSQGEISHDKKIGAAGELFVSNLHLKIYLT